MAAVRVDKATNELLLGPDWTLNIDICDAVNSDHGLGTFLQDFFHHSAMEMVCRVGAKVDRFKGCKMLNQNCQANTQEVRMCWAVSSS